MPKVNISIYSIKNSYLLIPLLILLRKSLSIRTLLSLWWQLKVFLFLILIFSGHLNFIIVNKNSQMYSLFSVIDSLKFLISYLLNIEVYVHGYIVCLQDVLLGEMTSHEQRSWCYKSLTQVPFIVRTTKFQGAVQVFLPTSESAHSVVQNVWSSAQRRRVQQLLYSDVPCLSFQVQRFHPLLLSYRHYKCCVF